VPANGILLASYNRIQVSQKTRQAEQEEAQDIYESHSKVSIEIESDEILIIHC